MLAVVEHPTDPAVRLVLTRDDRAPHPRDEDPTAWEHDRWYRASRADDVGAWHDGRVYRLRLQQRGAAVTVTVPGPHGLIVGESPQRAWHDIGSIGALYLDDPADTDLVAIAAEQWEGWGA